MAVISRLDMQLAMRKMRSKELAERVGVTVQTVSRPKTGKARAVRIDQLDAVCRELGCQPGDLLEYAPDGAGD